MWKSDINHYLEIVRRTRTEQRFKRLKEFIEKNRPIPFTINAISVDDVEKIHNIEEIEGLCPHCGYGSFTRYAVELKNHICLIFEERTACLTYSGEEPEMSLFQNVIHMDRYLVSKNYVVEEISDEMVESQKLQEWTLEMLKDC